MHAFTLGGVLGQVVQAPIKDPDFIRRATTSSTSLYDPKGRQLHDQFRRALEKLSSWLRFAAQIETVSMLSRDPGFGWCSDADAAAMRNEDHHASVATELIRFTLIWGALETALRMMVPDVVRLPKGPHRNTWTNRGALFLNLHFNPASAPPAYLEALGELERLLPRARIHIHDIPEFARVEKVGRGPFLVGILRNELAHGSFWFQDVYEPPETQDPPPVDRNILMHCSRIALFSIQMLAGAFFKGSTCVTYAMDDLDPDGVPVAEAIRVAHYERDTIDRRQLSFPEGAT